MLDRTLPMPTPEAAEAAANVCQLLAVAFESQNYRRGQWIARAFAASRSQDLSDWLDEVAIYRKGTDERQSHTPDAAQPCRRCLARQEAERGGR